MVSKTISVTVKCPACGAQNGERILTPPTELKCANCDKDILIDNFGNLSIKRNS